MTDYAQDDVGEGGPIANARNFEAQAGESEHTARLKEDAVDSSMQHGESAEQPRDAKYELGADDVEGGEICKNDGAHSRAEAMRVLEAVLFASGEILSPARLKEILPGNPDGRIIRGMVEAINGELQSQRHPFHIMEIAGGYQVRTAPYYSPWVRQLFKEKSAKRLSVQALECLAIIAYRQPITRAEIESIRGSLSDGAMKTLLERRMITVAGRSDKAGRPLLYATTKEFLAYFGLRAIDELPKIEEFEALAKEKMADITQELDRAEQSRRDQPGQHLPHETVVPIEADSGSARQSAESIDDKEAEDLLPQYGGSEPAADQSDHLLGE